MKAIQIEFDEVGEMIAKATQTGSKVPFTPKTWTKSRPLGPICWGAAFASRAFRLSTALLLTTPVEPTTTLMLPFCWNTQSNT